MVVHLHLFVLTHRQVGFSAYRQRAPHQTLEPCLFASKELAAAIAASLGDVEMPEPLPEPAETSEENLGFPFGLLQLASSGIVEMERFSTPWSDGLGI